MRFLVGLLFLTSFVYARNEQSLPEFNSAYGYIKNVGIPIGEKIRQAEALLNSTSRIIGGVPAGLGQYPFNAGLLGEIVGLDGASVCGGSLISTSRVLTAARCWFDGVSQAWRITVVLGSVRLYEGGTRIQSSAVISHPSYSPSLARNDIAVIYLPVTVTVSDTIATVALPTGSELFESFAGERAIAIGFGITSEGGSITYDQYLNHVSLNVISNTICSLSLPLIVQSSNICTSGVGGIGTCGGDSGGPLVIQRNGRPLLIGVTSIGSPFGCESGMPAIFARVTGFADFINQHL